MNLGTKVLLAIASICALGVLAGFAAETVLLFTTR